MPATRINPGFGDFFDAPKVILAPMAGITDAVFRSLCIEQGADLTFTEMVSAKGLSYENEKTENLLAVAPNEERVSVQLFGHEPAVLAAEAAKLEESLGERLFTINVNMGCPARKIVTKGDGSALMKDPALAADIVRAIKGAVRTPMTVKFRRGYELDQETCVDFAKAMEDAGADAITVHGRYALQMYHGTSDRVCIAKVKDAVGIPVTGNGDIKCGADALAMLRHTGCDAVMVARATEGNPWLFAEIRQALDAYAMGEEAPVFAAPTVRQRMDMAIRHAELACAQRGGGVRMRHQAMSYVAGLPGATAARQAICACKEFDEFKHVFEEVAAYAARSL